MSNPIVKKIFVKIEFETASPICISNGTSEHTDVDVLTDYEGRVLIPGSTIAGAMRDYCGYDEKDSRGPFGYHQGEDGRMSAIIVNDSYLDTSVKMDVRDGIKLKDKVAITGGKYDYEIVQTGAGGTMIIEAVVRANGSPETRDDEFTLKNALDLGIRGIENGEIRLGFKKNRGNGEIKIQKKQILEMTKDNAESLLGIYDRIFAGDESLPWKEYEYSQATEEGGRYTTIRVPLRLDGGISIRRYVVKKNEPDFEHITNNGKPVIPGTSWNGAIRTRVAENLAGIGKTTAEIRKILDEIFGYVVEQSSGGSSNSEAVDVAKQSRIQISESVLEGASPLHITRNQISRFEGATKKGALYQELSYFGGTTELCIRIRKEMRDGDYMTEQQIFSYLLPVLTDIQSGFLAVGGQTSIGRGIFLANGPMILNDEEYVVNNMIVL